MKSQILAIGVNVWGRWICSWYNDIYENVIIKPVFVCQLNIFNYRKQMICSYSSIPMMKQTPKQHVKITFTTFPNAHCVIVHHNTQPVDHWRTAVSKCDLATSRTHATWRCVYEELPHTKWIRNFWRGPSSLFEQATQRILSILESHTIMELFEDNLKLKTAVWSKVSK